MRQSGAGQGAVAHVMHPSRLHCTMLHMVRQIGSSAERRRQIAAPGSGASSLRAWAAHTLPGCREAAVRR
jgi:hypothetical protein